MVAALAAVAGVAASTGSRAVSDKMKAKPGMPAQMKAGPHMPAQGGGHPAMGHGRAVWA